jgi:prophage regulatory protein
MHTETTSSLNRHERRRAATLAGRSDPPANASTAWDEIIREPDCRRITGLSRSTRWRMERAGQFPRRRKISPGCTGWLASEIAAWIADR